MHRTTLMLPPDLKTRAQRRAREMGISLGEFVRQAIETELGGQVKSREADPLFADDVVWTGEVPSDLAVNHDRYLYDLEEP